jgi:molybdopterin synthase sulfur carrier subunit
MALVLLPRSLVALFPGMPRRLETADAATVGDLIAELDVRWPGLADRLCEPGPALRQYINVFVDREPADLTSSVRAAAVVHVLPAVAGG